MHGRAIQTVADVNRTISGKQFKGGQGEKDRAQVRLAELVRLLGPEVKDAAGLVIAGPGFLKEELARALLEAEARREGEAEGLSHLGNRSHRDR